MLNLSHANDCLACATRATTFGLTTIQFFCFPSLLLLAQVNMDLYQGSLTASEKLGDSAHMEDISSQELRTSETSTGRRKSLPSPHKLFVRLVVLLGLPICGRNRGLSILRLMLAMARQIHPTLPVLWNLVLPQMTLYLNQDQMCHDLEESDPDADSQGNTSFSTKHWQELTLKMLLKSIEQIADEKWTVILVHEFEQQTSLYDKLPDERGFLYRCLGVTLSKIQHQQTVVEAAELIIQSTNHDSPIEQECCAEALGFLSTNHGELVMDLLTLQMNTLDSYGSISSVDKRGSVNRVQTGTSPNNTGVSLSTGTAVPVSSVQWRLTNLFRQHTSSKSDQPSAVRLSLIELIGQLGRVIQSLDTVTFADGAADTPDSPIPALLALIYCLLEVLNQDFAAHSIQIPTVSSSATPGLLAFPDPTAPSASHPLPCVVSRTIRLKSVEAITGLLYPFPRSCECTGTLIPHLYDPVAHVRYRTLRFCTALLTATLEQLKTVANGATGLSLSGQLLGHLVARLGDTGCTPREPIRKQTKLALGQLLQIFSLLSIDTSASPSVEDEVGMESANLSEPQTFQSDRLLNDLVQHVPMTQIPGLLELIWSGILQCSGEANRTDNADTPERDLSADESAAETTMQSDSVSGLIGSHGLCPSTFATTTSSHYTASSVIPRTEAGYLIRLLIVLLQHRSKHFKEELILSYPVYLDELIHCDHSEHWSLRLCVHQSTLCVKEPVRTKRRLFLRRSGSTTTAATTPITTTSTTAVAKHRFDSPRSSVAAFTTYLTEPSVFCQVLGYLLLSHATAAGCRTPIGKSISAEGLYGFLETCGLHPLLRLLTADSSKPMNKVDAHTSREATPNKTEPSQMEHKGLLWNPDLVLEVVEVIGRYVIENLSQAHIFGLVRFFLARLNSTYEPHRMVVTKWLACVLSRANGRTVSIVADPLVSEQGSMTAAPASDPVVTPDYLFGQLLSRLEDPCAAESDLSMLHDALHSLSYTLPYTNSHRIAPLIGEMCERLWPIYMSVMDSIRAAAFELFGTLTLFAWDPMSEIDHPLVSPVSYGTLFAEAHVESNDVDSITVGGPLSSLLMDSWVIASTHQSDRSHSRLQRRGPISLMVFGNQLNTELLARTGKKVRTAGLEERPSDTTNQARQSLTGRESEIVGAKSKVEGSSAEKRLLDFFNNCLRPDLKLHQGEFFNELARLLVTLRPDQVADYTMRCTVFYNSDWPEIQCSAVLFSELLQLLRSNNADVRATAAHAISRLYRF
ncbi:hypothetical protein D915_001627 [Fasciola hepatica]|uniref:MROH2B-like HEAT-repeats domain-containing protein n=1 Tax=Fasciola hepatica TaxID=6192 RepID=A0A4E0RFB9_FASHE|nr:hypothetical protein D915_001627 [Fasciola hepatica]